MNYGIVGLGKQGKQHLTALKTLSNFDPELKIAICDIDEKHVDTLSKELGLQGFYSCKEMLENAQIDVLVLALPNDKYKEILELDELKNISVIKEKPLATSYEEAQLFIDVLNSKKVQFNIVQNRFFANHYNIAKKWMNDGLIGKILFFEYRYVLNDQKESWYWDPKAGGGCWINIGWHFAFMLEWFFGTPVSINVNKIQSSKRAWEYQTDDTVFVTCAYEGFTGRAYMSVVDSLTEDSFKIVGSNGTITISKDCAILMDNYGNKKEKEKAENLLSYVYQAKDIFKRDVQDKLLDYNIKAMKIISNNI